MRIFLTLVVVLSFFFWVLPSASADNGTVIAQDPGLTLVVEFSDTVPAYYSPDLGMVCAPVSQFHAELVADGIHADTLVGVGRVCEPAVYGVFGF
jgi:hypothetical protein